MFRMLDRSGSCCFGGTKTYKVGSIHLFSLSAYIQSLNGQLHGISLTELEIVSMVNIAPANMVSMGVLAC